jgi:chromosome segregation protein
LTNPAPICVLDEVDAPLDDSNVVRFCDLLRDICAQTDTRFLVITHHRMTMARMDRLFGITMEQRGISKLVSVDLQTAERIRDIATV